MYEELKPELTPQEYSDALRQAAEQHTPTAGTEHYNNKTEV